MQKFLLLFLLSGKIFAIDTVSCLQARLGFLDCAKRSQIEDFPMRDCLQAEIGYEQCRSFSPSNIHRRCLGAHSVYLECRKLGLAIGGHGFCLSADSGLKECLKWEKDPLLCIGVKTGYNVCREKNPSFSHSNCAQVNDGYADCIAAGGSHPACLNANASYSHCRKEQSHNFCMKVGRGYSSCRQAGYPLGTCYIAQGGFADCAAFDD